MLISLELENFKGIAERQRIEFAPLTLLFGANSAGKSTVLQGLLYLHELLETGGADVDRTEIGGTVMQLGGFGRLVHRHDTNNAIVIRAEFTTPGELELFGRDLEGFPFPNLDDQIESAWLELTIRFRTTRAFAGPIVERAVIGVGVDPLVWLETGTALREAEPVYVRINFAHPLLAGAAEDVIDSWTAVALSDEIFKAWLETGGNGKWGFVENSVFSDGSPLPVFVISRSSFSALPPVGEPLNVVDSGDEEEEDFSDPDDEEADQEEREAYELSIRTLETFLEMVILGTTSQLAAALHEALYIGPLRAVPTRGLLYDADTNAGRTRHPLGPKPRSGSKGAVSWADGLAAWDRLLMDRSSLVEETNSWLKKMDAGCQIVIHQLMDMTAAEGDDLPKGFAEEVVHRLMLKAGGSWVLPSEVGAGISQVVPVVVAALVGSGGLSLIEQPELHIHPALQVWLGDLFIEAATRDTGRGTMLIETHSEHLILRLLRRIRETTENEIPEGARAFSSDKLSVLYVENSPEGVLIRRLRVDEHGEFMDRWPKGFFDERFAEIYKA